MQYRTTLSRKPARHSLDLSDRKLAKKLETSQMSTRNSTYGPRFTDKACPFLPIVKIVYYPVFFVLDLSFISGKIEFVCLMFVCVSISQKELTYIVSL